MAADKDKRGARVGCEEVWAVVGDEGGGGRVARWVRMRKTSFSLDVRKCKRIQDTYFDFVDLTFR